MREQRVAILGGSGFIGRHVVKRLAERGDVVAVGGRNTTGAKYLRLKGDVGQVALFNVSLDDESLLPAFVAGNDAVVNLVGILAESGTQRFETLHHVGPARLARLAREAGVERFVQMSAIGADPRSTSVYARTKANGEAAVSDAFPTATILRPSVVFGPEDQFFNRLAATAMMSPVMPLIGGGDTRFQPVYVGDVAEAVVRIIDDSTTAGRVYELGGPKVYTLRELTELLLQEIRRKRLLVNLPFGLASLQARLLSLLPQPPLTPDQVEMLRRDNVVASGALSLPTLGIEPTAVEAILPTYLDRFRRGGWYARERGV
jgi:NADH dehydrogenase